MYNNLRKQINYFFNFKIRFLLLSSLIIYTSAVVNSYASPLQNENLKIKSELQAKELVFASWENNFEKIKSLVSDGVDINAQTGPGLTAYHCAKLRGNQTIQEWLLENGANPDIIMPEKNQIADLIFKRNADSDSPGGALAVVQDGSIVHTSYYGLANLEHNIPITPTTVFYMASVVKQVIGTAIGMLVIEGKISLEDDIHTYIPELYDFGYTIKIRHLLHHTAGFRDTMGSLSLAGWNLDDVITFDHLLTFALNQKGLNFEPGSEHLYSNTGYVLLRELIQRVTGETFRTWVESNVLQPLEMTQSHIHDDYTELVPGKANGYRMGKDGKFHASPNNAGMNGLYSTIGDMAKVLINLDTHHLGGEPLYNFMVEQGVLNNGEKIAYASALEIGQHRGIKTIHHGGGWAGFTTLIMYFPEYHFSAVVLYNINSDVYGAISDIADVFLGEKLDSKIGNDQDKSTPQNINVPDDMLDKYIGTYKVFPAWYFTISRDGSQLMALETNKEIYPLPAISENEFRVDARNQIIKFNMDDSGDVTDFDFLGIMCPKVEEGTTPSQSPLTEDLTGDYYCEELAVKYTIAIENGQLIAKHRRHGTANLMPAWKENFRCDWWFMRSVEFNRDENGIVEGLTVTQWQSRNHRFVKI